MSRKDGLVGEIDRAWKMDEGRRPKWTKRLGVVVLPRGVGGEDLKTTFGFPLRGRRGWGKRG